jgi:hypothetical protein
MPAFDEEPIPGSEASDAVRAAPEEAATVVRAWIDGGDVERAARLVVALDASAAATILHALPVTHVQQVTAALSTLTPLNTRNCRKPCNRSWKSWSSLTLATIVLPTRPRDHPRPTARYP